MPTGKRKNRSNIQIELNAFHSYECDDIGLYVSLGHPYVSRHVWKRFVARRWYTVRRMLDKVFRVGCTQSVHAYQSRRSVLLQDMKHMKELCNHNNNIS
jgi:hypothetical protein